MFFWISIIYGRGGGADRPDILVDPRGGVKDGGPRPPGLTPKAAVAIMESEKCLTRPEKNSKRDGRKMGMKWMAMHMTLGALLMALLGCTVISRPIMNEAEKGVTLAQLRADADRYRGQTVVLGGHIIEVRNEARQTVLVVLQTPLGSGQEPRSPDRSEGRFLLHAQGFLDPEVYAKGRKITVAGRVLGRTREAIGEEPYDYPTLDVREIYLWERPEDVYRYRPPYRPPYYDPWYYRYRRYGYPYR